MESKAGSSPSSSLLVNSAIICAVERLIREGKTYKSYDVLFIQKHFNLLSAINLKFLMLHTGSYLLPFPIGYDKC